MLNISEEENIHHEENNCSILEIFNGSTRFLVEFLTCLNTTPNSSINISIYLIVRGTGVNTNL